MKMSRRGSLRGVALFTGALALGGCAAATTAGNGTDGGPLDAPPDDARRPFDGADAPFTPPDDVPDIFEPVDATLEPELDAGALPDPAGGTSAPAARCATADEGLPVCAGVCGNGTRDTCMLCRSCLPSPRADVPVPRDVSMCCSPVSEECDGAAVSSCVDLGFRGGTVRCSGACRHDTSGCERCATAANVERCAAPAAAQSVGANFGLSVDGDTVALAWASAAAGSAAGNTVHLALYTPELTLRVAAPCVAAPGATQASVAATARGWVVAYDRVNPSRGALEVAVQRFTRAGVAEGAPLVFAGASAPHLTRGAGLVLLEYQLPYASTGSPVAAALVSDEGAVVSSPRVIFEGTYGLDHESAVWAGDAFLISARDFNGRVDATQVVRMERDGRLTSRVRPVGAETEYAQLTWDGERAGLLYGAFGGSDGPFMAWQRLDANGAPVSEGSGVLTTLLPTYAVAYAAALGPGRYYVAQSTGSRIEGFGMNRGLALVGSRAPVGRGGEFSTNDRVRVAPMGERVVVAWTETAGDGGTSLAAAVVRP